RLHDARPADALPPAPGLLPGDRRHAPAAVGLEHEHRRSALDAARAQHRTGGDARRLDHEREPLLHLPRRVRRRHLDARVDRTRRHRADDDAQGVVRRRDDRLLPDRQPEVADVLVTRLRSLRDDQGSALLLVVLLAVILAMLATLLVEVVQADETRSTRAVQEDASLQAAEAGIDNYVSKLVDDNQFYLHDVAAGESSRKSGTNPVVSSSCSGTPTPATWTYGITWTYPNGKDQWCSLGNGYEYNLQVSGTSSSSNVVDIVATGRKTGTTTQTRILEEQIRPSSVADFQMLANADIAYGATATTYGKIYAGIDSSNVKHNIDHQGTAYGNLYAEGSITGSPTMMNGAQKYTSANIRTVIKQPIQFSNFTTSLTDINRAATLTGTAYNDASAVAWKLTFNGSGTVDVAKCTSLASGQAIEMAAPTCNAPTTINVPAKGAMYFQQSVIVAGGTSTCGSPAVTGNCVNGRVTVASANDIVVATNIDYMQPGDDVLG